MRAFVLILVLSSLSIFGQTVIKKTGDRGVFEFMSAQARGDKYPQFAIMHQIPNGGKVGEVFGFITPETQITVLNRKISKKDIDLLDGKEVVVIGTFKYVGKGEGSQVYCQQIEILVIEK